MLANELRSPNQVLHIEFEERQTNFFYKYKYSIEKKIYTNYTESSAFSLLTIAEQIIGASY